MPQGRLVRYSLRVYVDPESTISGPQFWRDLDELQYHTQELGAPCLLQLCVPNDNRNWSFWSVPHLRFEVACPSPEAATRASVAAAEIFFGAEEHHVRARTLASAALAADCDFVLCAELAARPEITHGFRQLHVELVDETAARAAIEVFMRGHEIPWGFGLHMWQWPWIVFYPHVESGIRAMQSVLQRAANEGASSVLLEYIRSVGFSRWSALAYTRDKLLFFALQRRAAKRNGIELQDFSFELSYYLNYYYFLLWGGLDQVCWIANEACGLGFTAKNAPAVGIQKKEFGRCLERQAPEVAEEFAKSAFVEWLNRLKLIRHHSSHQGFPMLTTLFEAPAITPNQEQMDSEIEAWPEWLEAKEMLGPELLEASRAVFRNKWIEKNCRLISDAVLGVPDDKGFSAVSPLQHITEDFKIFQDFVLRVTELCVNRLSTNTPTP